MSSSELHTLQRAFAAAGGKWSTFVIWAKNTFTLGRADYQRQYEPILYGWTEGSHHYWCGTRDQGDVWFVNKPMKNDLYPTISRWRWSSARSATRASAGTSRSTRSVARDRR
jgi:DNA modification methylase